MKENFKLLCFGFGQVAKYFVKNLIKNQFKFELITTNTTKTQFKDFDGLKYKSYYFFNNLYDKELLEDLRSSNKILVSIPPKNEKDIVLETFNQIFQKNNFDWVTYLSATSVYGNKNGEWVNEDVNPEPTNKRGILRLKAENDWLKFHKLFNLPVQIFRLSGIYSLENNILKRLKMGDLKIIKKSNHFFSRIHVEDIAQILTISLKIKKPGEIFNISDDYPCSNKEIAKYAAKIMKTNDPEEINLEDIKSEMLKEFYKDSKKVDNKKMKFFFNYKLKYPTYKDGLKMIKDHKI